MHLDPDLDLDRLLHRQHGAFSRDQAVASGFTPRMIDHRLRSQMWRRVDESVYARSSYPPTWEQRAMSAVLSEPTAVLGGRTGAVVYELPDFRRGSIEITVPPDQGHPSRLAKVRRSTLLERRVVHGFPVNSLPLVFVELAATVSERRLDRAVEEAILRNLITMDELIAVYLRIADSRRTGIGKLRAIIDERADGVVPAESELEARLFAALAGPDIPPITRQAPFPWSPNDPQRVDGFIEAWDILLEGDGRRWHARLQTMEADRRRDQEALRRGYHPLRFGWNELRDDPGRVRAIVVDVGHRRAAA